MAKIMTAAASFMSELMYISRDIVWKDQTAADKLETYDTLKESGQFMAAKNGDLTFASILSFNLDILENAGVPSDIRLECFYDKWQIPSRYRDLCVKLQTEFIINNYEEHNDYYRMLYGLPTMEEMNNNDFLYNTKYPDICDPNIPIHELDIMDVYTLEDRGYIDELKAAHPDKKYLKYLGRRKIEPFVARSAERFSLLYMTQSEFVRINTDFRDTYAICRYAVLRSVYAGERRKDNEYYESFMAMLVLFMTINQMFAKYLDADINRDFYDYESIKYVYDHYGVPFYPEIPLNYHIKIIKNINILLRYKGSTEVFYKLFDIFNFGAMEVFDYYLVKVQKTEGGQPVFVYNEDGTENVRAMYDIKFGEVELYNNPPLELSNPENIKAYSDLTAFDPYWDDDDEMMEKLYNMDYNYIESKYIGFSCVFDLMSITYESALFFKLMFDTRSITETFLIYYGPVSMNISLYDLIIYICALVCKRYGYDVALNKPALYLSSALGFNTKANMKVVRQSVLDNPAINDDAELISLLTDMNINSAASIGLVFERIQSLRELLVRRKAFAKSTEEFQAYNQLEKTLMVSEYMEDGFLRECKMEYNPSDPSTWYGFIELLGDVNPSLATKVIDIGGNVNDVDENGNSKLNVSTIDAEIQTALVTLRKIVTSLEYIEMCCSGGIEAMLNYLFKMLDFFKSAKAQLTGFNLAYTIGKDGSNAVKLFYEYDRGEIEVMVQKFIYTIFTYIQRLFLKMSPDKKYFSLKDFLQWEWSHTYIDDLMAILFRFKILKTIIHETRIEMDLHDVIHRHMHEQMMKDKLLFDDDMKLIYEKLFCDLIEYYINDGFKELTDVVIKCTTTYHYVEKSDMNWSDEIQYNLGRIYKNEKLPIEIEEYMRKYMSTVKVDAGNIHLDYSPIDLDGNFNLLLGNLGMSLFQISDALMKVSETLGVQFRDHMSYMLRSFMRIHHIWARSDLYMGTSLRWVKSHVYLKQLLNIICDCHKLTTFEKRVDYNIDFDSVVHYVNQKARFDDLLDMGDELELLYEYIEQYYYEYIVNDQFEEFIDAIINQRTDLKEFKKLALTFADEIQDWMTGKHSGSFTQEFRWRDTTNEYRDADRLTYFLDFKSLSVNQIEIFAKSLCELYFKHNGSFIENKEIIKNEITTLFKHYLVVYLYKFHDLQLMVDDLIIAQDEFRAGFNDSIRYLVKHYLCNTFVKQEIKSDFDLWVVISNINEGIMVKDALNLVADETPKLIAERIYSEVIDYVINDRFEVITDEMSSITYEQFDYESNFIAYLAKLNHDYEHSMDYEREAISMVVDEISRLNEIEYYVKSDIGYNLDFSPVDLNGDPGILFTMLGESITRLFAEISLHNTELADKIKNHISYATKLIDGGTTFILEGTIPMFLSEVHAADRKEVYKDLFVYLAKVHKCTEILSKEVSSMGYRMDDGKLYVETTLKSGFHMSAALVGDLISDTLQFLIDDHITDITLRFIKLSDRYEKMDIASICLDEKILPIALAMMSKATMLLVDEGTVYEKSTNEERQLLLDEMNDIDVLYKYGQYTADLYIKLMNTNFECKDILEEKVDLLFSHILALIEHYEKSDSVLKMKTKMLERRERPDERLLMLEGIYALVSHIKKYGFDASIETMINLISSNASYTDSTFVFDNIELNELSYRMIALGLNANEDRLIDTIDDIYYHHKSEINIGYDDLLSEIEYRIAENDRVLLYDSDYLKSIRMVYKALKFIIGGKYDLLKDDISHVYNDIKHEKLNRVILTDKLLSEKKDKDDLTIETIQRIFMMCVGNRNTVTDIQEITNPLFLEYRDRVVNSLCGFIFNIKEDIKRLSIESKNIIKNDMRYIFTYIIRAYASWINSIMILFDKLVPNSDGIQVDEINEYSLKLKRISNILLEQRFSTYLIDSMKNFISETYIKDALLYGDQMNLISEELYMDVVEYLLNDQFAELSDKLINCIYINRYINNSYATIHDWLHCDNNYYSFDIKPSLKDEMKKLELKDGITDSLYFFMTEMGVNESMIKIDDTLLPLTAILKKVGESSKNFNNNFRFETELIVEYEQKVEN